MKCVCGLDRLHNTVLCRMLETGRERFKVEIYDPSDDLLAESAGELTFKKALAFVKAQVDRRVYTTHFHWGEAEEKITKTTPMVRNEPFNRSRKMATAA